ncbi:FAD-binding protein [Pseudopedobacter beijingensis]|uniref:FAD-binding protein n=1 Tax=Pseudopedobacter beijingensis TaxID=1207056 RepID=A0ABW4IH50_9SPHI
MKRWPLDYFGVIKKNIPVWTNTTLVELLKDGERIVGAIVEQHGKKVTVNVRKGVVLAAGGFDHNLPMRQKYQSHSLTEQDSLGAEGNMGDAIFMPQMKLNAATALMEESWWFPAIAPVKKGGMPQIMLAERSLPGSFMVNSEAKRFINESEDYMSFGQTILKYEKEGTPVKEMWLIFDQKYRNNYILAGSVMPAMPLPKEWYEKGIAHKANSVVELANKMGVPAVTLTETFSQFNAMAMKGRDLEFDRGESEYDRYYGDPTVKPNPNLRPLNEKKIYAVKVVLADLGTCGGLLADEYARVLNKDGVPIEGLYAIGNNSSNVFGRVYPGAGATISQGLVFGYIAAHHMSAIE